MFTKIRKASKLRISLLIFATLIMFFAIPVAAQTTTPVDFIGFAGSGFAQNPAAGQLDSNLWRVTGLSDGIGSFGGTHTSGDFARESSTGGVGTGGIYAFDVGGGDTILGVQPGGSDFTPGTLTLLVINNTGATVSNVYIAYEIWTYNDQARSNSLNFSWSLDDSSYTLVPAFDYSTPGAADITPAWQVTSCSTTLIGVNLADGASIYLQWTGDDVSGGGTRDEYGIDDIEVRVGGPTALTFSTITGENRNNNSLVFLAGGMALLLVSSLFLLLRRRKTA